MIDDENFDCEQASSKRRKSDGQPFVESVVAVRRDDWVSKLQQAVAIILLTQRPLATDKCHTLLGAGEFAQVFAYRISNDVSVAYKKIRLSKEESRKPKVRLEVAIEGRVMSFLTDTFLQPILFTGPSPPSLGCPNFIAVLRHDFGRNVVRFVGDEADYREKDITASSLWLEMCEKTNFYDYYAVKQNVPEPLREPLAVSVIGQMMMAILGCGGVGLFHNDMRMTNWLLRSRSTPKSGLLYCIPAATPDQPDVYVRLPGEHCIPLMVVSDFGLASIEGWKNDPRVDGFENCAESVAMMCNYYKLPERNDRDLLRLSLTSNGDSYGHFRPLSFGKLQRHQRDMATILSFFEAMNTDNEAVGEFQRLAGKAIDALTDIRPTSYVDQRRVVLKMFAEIPEFAACVVAKPAPESTEKVFRLPNDAECTTLSKKLFDRVSASVKNRNEYKLTLN